MAVMLTLDFDAYFIPPVAGADEFQERIAANNAEVEILKKLWKDFQHYENQALPMFRKESLKGITYFGMQEMLAAAIDTSIQIIERERVLHDSLCQLLQAMGAAQAMDFAKVAQIRNLIQRNHMQCSNFATKIKQHLQRTLFVDLQIG